MDIEENANHNNFGNATKTFSSKINELPKLKDEDEEEPF